MKNINNKEIVVSRYNEDISWLNKISKDIDIIIYNKGNNDININGSNIKVINIPNIGREGQTFLNHIIENYNRLYYNTIFLQGNPSEHCKSFLEIVNNKKTDSILYISDWIPKVLAYSDQFMISRMEYILKEMELPDFNTESTFSAGAQYIINRNIIKRKDINWWIKLYNIYISDIDDEINYKKSCSNPWVFERIWPIIYNDTSTEMSNSLPSNYGKI